MSCNPQHLSQHKATIENMNEPRKGALRDFVHYYKSHLGLFLLDMFCALIIALVDILYPALTRRILYDFIPNQLVSQFVKVILLLLFTFIVRSIAQWIVTYLGHYTGVLIEGDMRNDLYAHLQTLDFSFFDNNHTGHLMSRITTDLFDVTELAHHGPEDLFISIVTLLGSFIVLWSIQPRLALILMITVPCIILFIISRRKAMSRVSKEVKKQTSSINAEVNSALSGMRTVQAFNNEVLEADKFHHCTSDYIGAKKRYYRVMADFFAGNELMMNLMSLSIICFGSWFIMHNQMDLATLITFNMYVASVQAPIRKLTNFTEQYTAGMAGFQRFRTIMHVKPRIVDSPNAISMSSTSGDIRFENVSFSYDGNEKTVLNNINLHIHPGKMLALVGPSGGGKSTLCQLIPRFYDISAGSITLDGQDIRDIRIHDLRSMIGIVQQDVFLFSGTVYDNIAYGKPDATPEEVILAAKQAEIHEDILKMPKQYQTEVGERGILLSGGQKQRISIARIFLKNPQILILDEATSALDTITERHIQATFSKLCMGRTTLVIAHRLSTVRNADEIIVITENGIIERGTHDELVQKNGLYASLAQESKLNY